MYLKPNNQYYKLKLITIFREETTSAKAGFRVGSSTQVKIGIWKCWFLYNRVYGVYM